MLANTESQPVIDPRPTTCGCIPGRNARWAVSDNHDCPESETVRAHMHRMDILHTNPRLSYCELLIARKIYITVRAFIVIIILISTLGRGDWRYYMFLQ